MLLQEYRDQLKLSSTSAIVVALVAALTIWERWLRLVIGLNPAPRTAPGNALCWRTAK